MSAHNQNDIVELAELFHEYVFEDNTDYHNLEYYLEEIGIEIYYAELEDVDGYLRINSDTELPRIVIKANQYAPRQRFTMAHELGHLILHYKFLPWEDWKRSSVKEENEILEVAMFRGSTYNSSESRKEKEANDFAGAFLMPSKKIRMIIEEFNEKNCRKIKRSELRDLISDKFKVSGPAASMRLKNLL